MIFKKNIYLFDERTRNACAVITTACTVFVPWRHHVRLPSSIHTHTCCSRSHANKFQLFLEPRKTTVFWTIFVIAPGSRCIPAAMTVTYRHSVQQQYTHGLWSRFVKKLISPLLQRTRLNQKCISYLRFYEQSLRKRVACSIDSVVQRIQFTPIIEFGKITIIFVLKSNGTKIINIQRIVNINYCKSTFKCIFPTVYAYVKEYSILLATHFLQNCVYAY